MDALQAAAIEAVEKATADTELGGSLKIKALKFLRDATGLSLPKCAPAVEWAMSRPRTTLTRADKERAVKKLASRLADACEDAACEDAAYKDCGQPAGDTKDIAYYRRRQYLLRKALVRLAMARTVD